MSSDTDTLSPKQQRAIAALLTSKTDAEAAQAVGVDARTLYRWMRQPAFVAALREAGKRAVEIAGRRLQGLTGKAAETLDALMDCVDLPTRGRVAAGIIDRAFRFTELQDVQHRLDELEQRLARRK